MGERDASRTPDREADVSDEKIEGGLMDPGIEMAVGGRSRRGLKRTDGLSYIDSVTFIIAFKMATRIRRMNRKKKTRCKKR